MGTRRGTGLEVEEWESPVRGWGVDDTMQKGPTAKGGPSPAAPEPSGDHGQGMSETEPLRKVTGEKKGESRGAGRRDGHQGLPLEGHRDGLKSSKHTRGLEPLGNLEAGDSPRFGWIWTVASKGPWDHSQDPGFQPCLCISCSVTWSLSLSLPRPHFPHLSCLTLGFGLGQDLIS